MTLPRLLDDSAPPHHPPMRLGRALSLSLGSHAAAALVLTLFATGRTSPMTSAQPSSAPASIVWVPQTGEAGGTRGGGDKTPTARRSAEMRGPGVVAVPAAPPRSVIPTIDPRDDDPAKFVAPLPPITGGLQNVVGVLERVTIGAPDARGPGSGPSAGPGSGSRPGLRGSGGIGDGAGTDGIVPPRLIRQVRPEYTSAAMHARIQGMVTVEAVVMADGTVGDVKVVRSLDTAYGLDQAAIAAVKQWRFMAGTRVGKPIPMLVTVELTFTLR